jgi:hypothetical protein
MTAYAGMSAQQSATTSCASGVRGLNAVHCREDAAVWFQHASKMRKVLEAYVREAARTLWETIPSDFFRLLPIPVRRLPTGSRPLPGQVRNVPAIPDSRQELGAAALHCYQEHFFMQAQVMFRHCVDEQEPWVSFK